MKHRLFLAIELPLSLRPQVARLTSQLDTLNLPVIWQPPEKLHLTLNFLGKVDGDNIPVILKRVGEICDQTPVFNLQPYFLETLYSRHDPSIIFLMPTGDIEILKNFQKQLSDAFSAIRLPQSKKFLPHFTIGTLERTDPVSTKNFLDKINEVDFQPLPTFPVEKVTLFESLVSRAGTKYQKLHDLHLG